MVDDFRATIIALFIVLFLLIYMTYVWGYVDQVQETIAVQYSKPYIKAINSSEYIVTIRTIIYASSSTVYVEPFLVNPTTKSPIMLQGKYVNQVFDPDQVGFVNVSGVSTKPVVIYSPSCNGVAFKVPTEVPFNITFTTNQSYALELEIYVSTPLLGYQEVGSTIIPLNIT